MSALGSRRRWLLRAPSLAGALFLCRETRKLPFDCGSPRTGRGARQSGSEWQRGKGGALPAPAASRVRSPPGAAATAAAAAAAAALARRQPRGKRPAPAGRPERAQHVAPRAAVGAPGHRSPSAEPGREALAAERDAEPGSRAGPVHRAEPAAGEWTGRSPATRGAQLPRTHFLVSSLLSWGGRGLDFFISPGKKDPPLSLQPDCPRQKSHFFLLLFWGRSSWETVATPLPPGCAPGCAESGGRVEWRRGELAVELPLGSPGCGLQLLSLVPLQTGLGEPARCNFTVTESRVSSRAASLQWRTLGPPCNFSLIYSNDTSRFTRCHPVRIDNTTYECNPTDLQAGTIYNFRIVALDGEERTVVLQTGKGMTGACWMARPLRAEASPASSSWCFI